MSAHLSSRKFRTYRKFGTSTGFTLTELLIVITLIAILAIAGLVLYQLQLAKAYDSIRKRDLNNLKIAFEHYYSDHACYPSTNILNNCGGTGLQPYLDKIPCDPQTGLPYTLTLDLPNGCAQKFFVFADLANTADPQILCNGRYVAASANTTQSELNAICRGQSYCTNGYFGCIAGTCQLVSAISKPSCSPLFCYPTCQNSCTIDNNGDSVYDFELEPQPCIP